MQREKIEDQLNQLVGVYSLVEEEISLKVLEERLEKLREELFSLLNAEFTKIRNEVIDRFKTDPNLKQVMGEIEEGKRLIRVLLLSVKQDAGLAQYFTRKIEQHTNEIKTWSAGITAQVQQYQPQQYQNNGLFGQPRPMAWKDEIKRHLDVTVHIKGQNINLTHQSLFFGSSPQTPFYFGHPQPQQGGGLFTSARTDQRVPQSIQRGSIPGSTSLFAAAGPGQYKQNPEQQRSGFGQNAPQSTTFVVKNDTQSNQNQSNIFGQPLNQGNNPFQPNNQFSMPSQPAGSQIFGNQAAQGANQQSSSFSAPNQGMFSQPQLFSFGGSKQNTESSGEEKPQNVTPN